MSRILVTLLTALVLVVPHFAEARQSPGQGYTQEASPNESELDSHRHYVNKDGQSIHSPAKSTSGAIPAGASAQCRDGTYSFSRHRSGTCSRHGGVGQWL